jgi:hypothetical protein
VSLLADGMMVAISSPFNAENGDASGQVRVYQIDGQGLSWERLGQVIYGNNADDYFRWSVNLSPDGNTLAIGSPGGGLRYVRVSSLEVGDGDINTGSWKQIGLDIIGEEDGNEFGISVSLSDDGQPLAVVAWTNDGNNGLYSGHVRVYRMDANPELGWMQLGNNIDGEAVDDLSGESASLSADGNTVAIGSPGNDDNGFSSGHVRVFVLG